jgi:hypothetical protein
MGAHTRESARALAEEMKPAKRAYRVTDSDGYIEYKVRNLPHQLDRAKRKVAALETEAGRLGMKWLVP